VNNGHYLSKLDNKEFSYSVSFRETIGLNLTDYYCTF